jgi:hypothetical protein
MNNLVISKIQKSEINDIMNSKFFTAKKIAPRTTAITGLE